MQDVLSGQEIEASPGIDYEEVASTRLACPDSGLNVAQIVTNRLQLFTLEGFMSDEECDRLADIVNVTLRPSTVKTGVMDKAYRTSSTSDLSLLDDSYVAAIDERIARTLGIRLPYSEGTQAQRYEVGQEFKQHTDYFEPGSVEHDMFAGDGGQRTWTFMVYLNDGVQGGGTKFFAIDKTFAPRKGMAVIWNNLFIEGIPNPNTLHCGLPVEAGHKIIITKWFRERGIGPMFYDD